MENIFDGKMSDITHIPHFLVSFERKKNLKSFDKTWNSFDKKDREENRVLVFWGRWRENHIMKFWEFAKGHLIIL
jgi:hypothetical protein